MTAERARVAIVTGGGNGIGAATVRALTAAGLLVCSFDVVAAIDRAEDSASGASAALNVQMDVSDADSVTTAVKNVIDTFGRLDVLVNNAAVLECYAVHDTPESVWDRVFDVNVKGSYLMSRACIPHLRVAGGSIVNVSSVHALASIPRTAAYAASKGAILSLSRQMAVDYADDNIRVNSVVVGSVDTAMSTRHARAIRHDGLVVTAPAGRLGHMGQASEIADAIAYLSSPAASFVTGAELRADGGLLSRLM